MSRIGWCAILILWGVATSGGYFAALKYSSTASSLRSPPSRWPNDDRLKTDYQRPTMLLFLHPMCPCSRATVRELDRFVARFRERVTVKVVAYFPPEATPDWERSELLAAARQVPGVEVIVDRDQLWRRSFNPSTSGECLLYGVNGRLQFHGGLTPARGHEGHSAGQDSLAELLLHDATAFYKTLVYGCKFDSANIEQVAK